MKVCERCGREFHPPLQQSRWASASSEATQPQMLHSSATPSGRAAGGGTRHRDTIWCSERDVGARPVAARFEERRPPRAEAANRRRRYAAGRREGSQAPSGARRRSPSTRSTRAAVGRTRDALDLPDLPAERRHIRGVLDDLERRRPVQALGDDGEGAVAVDLQELASVRHRR